MISVIVPIFNEESNISRFLDNSFEVLKGMGEPFELIAIDDGSTDQSVALLVREAEIRQELKVIICHRNAGQTSAIMAGIDHSTGDVIIPIDADLQNDPKDIPRILKKLREGYDVVSGWRKKRKDARYRRNLVSRIANMLISRISGVKLRDYGCTLKAYRRDILSETRLYGEMHRFIPIYASWRGARITELEVDHHARVAGESKYGLERVFKVILDLIVVMFLDKYMQKPIYIFGGFGILSFLLSGSFLVYMLYLKFIHGVSMIQTPLPTLVAVTFLFGALSTLLGLVAELLVRTYYESQRITTYSIKKKVNFN